MADNYISTNMNTGVEVKQALERIESYQPDLFVWTEISDSVIVNLKSPTTYSGIKDPGDYVIYKFSNGPSDIPSTLSPILLSLRNGNICVTANGSSYIYDGSAWHDVNDAVDDTTVVYIKDNVAPTRTKNTFWFDTSKFDGTENGYIDLKYYNETTKTWESVFNSKNYLKKSTLDPDNKKLDIFDYIDKKVADAVGDYGDFLKHIDNKLTLIHVSADDRVKYAKIINASELQELINNTYKPALKTAVDTSVSTELDTTNLEESVTNLETAFDEHINGKINITWTQGTMPNSQTWTTVCYGNNKYVAIAYDSNIFAYSTDGINWTQGTMPNSQSWTTVCYGNGKFVATAVVSNIFAYSTDGINWTEGNMPSEQNWPSICYGNDKFVAIASGTNIFAYSTDGINWTDGTIPSSKYLQSVCYGNGKFVAIAQGSNVFAYSSDGITWTEGTMPSKQIWVDICYGNGKFIAIVYDTNIFAYSTDGITWTEGTMPSKQKWDFVCYGNCKFVAIVYDTNIFAYSTDGITWTQGTLPSKQGWYSVCYGNDKFVAITRHSNVFAYSAGDIPPHVTADDIARWKNKADANHTHDYTTGTTKIDASQIVDGTFTADKLPDEIKERYYAAGKKTINLSTTKVGDALRLGKYQVENETPWPIEWEIVHQESDYQIAMTKQIIDLRCFDAKESNNTDSNRKKYGNNNWSVSNIEQFLNSDQASWYSAQHQYDAPPSSANVLDNYNSYDTHKGFLYYWSEDDKSLLQDMTLTLANNTVTDGGGSYTWTGKIWLPTYTQMGFGQNNSISEGTQFSKFTDDNSRIKTINKYCAENNKWCIDNSKTEGTNRWYWMSSVRPSYSYDAHSVRDNGSDDNGLACNGNRGLAPCISLPRTSTTIEVELTPEEEFSNTSLTDTDRATKYHNGNAFYFTTTDAYGKLTYRWFRIIDSTKIGTADWANGVSEFTATESVLDWNSISGRPTTLEEFGITNDLYTKTQVDEKFSSSKTKATEFSESTKELDGTVEYEFEGETIIEIGNSTKFETDGVNICTSLDIPYMAIDSNYLMCYGNGKFVAVIMGSKASISSTDGVKWTLGTMPSEEDWSSLCYGNGVFVAVSGNNIDFAYSTDGINWTAGTLPCNRGNGNEMCYGNGKFVIASTNGAAEKNFAYSTDGINWTAFTGISGAWGSICYGNGKFVVVAGLQVSTDVFAYSSDGITWTEGTMPSKQIWVDICYGNGKFIAIAGASWFISSNSSNVFAYSTDGINWTEGTLPSTDKWTHIYYGDNKFVIISDKYIIISTDGINWTYDYKYLSMNFISMCNKDKELYYIGYPTIYTNIEYKLKNIKYAELYLYKYNSNFNHNYNMSSLCYGDNKFVAISLGGAFAYSADGITWTQGTMPTEEYWNVICYGNNKFVAIANNSDVFAYSNDGITWTEGTMPSSQYWQSVCYGNGKYVAIAYNSNIFAYSSNSINWTQGTMPSSQKWKSVCYGNNKFVAIADESNVFAYSTDGINWTKGTMPSEELWNSICYGNGKFVAVTSFDIFAYSSDGITWTKGTIPTEYSEINDTNIDYVKDRFILTISVFNTQVDGHMECIDLSTDILYSIDGINWNIIDTIDSNVDSIAHADNNLIMHSLGGIKYYATTDV